jgi:hypothetical protein
VTRPRARGRSSRRTLSCVPGAESALRSRAGNGAPLPGIDREILPEYLQPIHGYSAARRRTTHPLSGAVLGPGTACQEQFAYARAGAGGLEQWMPRELPSEPVRLVGTALLFGVPPHAAARGGQSAAPATCSGWRQSGARRFGAPAVACAGRVPALPTRITRFAARSSGQPHRAPARLQESLRLARVRLEECR